MTFTLIRKNGRIRGIAITLGDTRIVAATEPGKSPWRVCDVCYVRDALVFCRRHGKYICGSCLGHVPSVHAGCEFLSVAVARDLARLGEKYGCPELVKR